MPALPSPPRDDLSSRTRAHPRAKSVPPLPPPNVGLIGALHRRSPVSTDLHADIATQATTRRSPRLLCAGVCRSFSGVSRPRPVAVQYDHLEEMVPSFLELRPVFATLRGRLLSTASCHGRGALDSFTTEGLPGPLDASRCCPQTQFAHRLQRTGALSGPSRRYFTAPPGPPNFGANRIRVPTLNRNAQWLPANQPAHGRAAPG